MRGLQTMQIASTRSRSKERKKERKKEEKKEAFERSGQFALLLQGRTTADEFSTKEDSKAD
jgi:hypothetical protein